MKQQDYLPLIAALIAVAAVILDYSTVGKIMAIVVAVGLIGYWAYLRGKSNKAKKR